MKFSIFRDSDKLPRKSPCHLGKQFFAALFLELHSDDLLALRREVGLRTGVAERHEIADDEQSGIAVLVVGKKLTGGRSEQVLLPEKELDELALRDFQFLRRRSDIGAVIRIDEGVVVIGFGLRRVQLTPQEPSHDSFLRINA